MRQLTIAAMLLLWPGQALADVTGIYAAYDEQDAQIIHIVESADGILRGQVEFIEIDSGNDVKVSSRNLTGTARKSAVAIILDMPIMNWFSSTTFTGSLSGGVLKLSYSGETGEYRRVNEAVYARIKRQIDLTAEKRKHDALVATAKRHFMELSKNVENLSRRASDEAAWFRQTKQDYAAFFSEIDSLQKQWRAYRESGADDVKLIKIENRQYEVEKMIWDLDSKAQARSASLRGLRIQIEGSSKKLQTLCGEQGLRGAEAACSGLGKIAPEFETAISEIRKAFDELAKYRETRKI